MTDVSLFLLLTFGISLIAFAGIALVKGAQTPESAVGLPFWLFAVWAPSLAAFVLACRQGELAQMLAHAIDLASVPGVVWVLAGSPIFVLILVALRQGGLPQAALLTPGMILKLIALNLVLGPLGEEFGWRGFLQPAFAESHGWFLASLGVGVIWFVWHLPLWLIESPQAEIPLPVFAAHVMAYSVILGAMTLLAGGSLAPAILFHLAVNAVAGVALVGGLGSSAEFYRWSVVPYLALSLIVAAVVIAIPAV